jgi:hypothetical protein
MSTSNLCKRCKNKFRRVFIPLKPEQYVDENGDPIFDNNEDNVVIMNMCLVATMDVEGEATVECDHFIPKANENVLSFFSLKEM